MNDPGHSEGLRSVVRRDDGDVEMDPKIQEILGRALKAHYDDLVGAPIPDRFLVLLAELEAKEARDGR